MDVMWIRVSEDAESWHIVKDDSELITRCNRTGDEMTKRPNRPPNKKTCEICFRTLDLDTPVAPV
jgi:hypothetical protein